KEQHVTVPAHTIDAGFFKEGKMFDGSSISGWKGINESDMVLMPDTTTAVLDPFMDEPTMIVTCDILEPHTMRRYERVPRSLAKRAAAYQQCTEFAATAYFGPGKEYFVFDGVRWGASMEGALYTLASEEASWSSERVFENGNIGYRPTTKGG